MALRSLPGQGGCISAAFVGSGSLKLVPITAELRRVLQERATLSRAEANQLMVKLLLDEASPLQVAALLGALAARGETADELAGFALAMRAAAVPLPLTEAERDQLVDTCGTGGDGSDTFNISTAAALVAAAAGAKVAKHGNRAVTSRCGSADVLEALGIPITLAPEAGAAALRAHGFCFLLAPAHHPGMRTLLPVRQALGVRTIFNVLGPLLNPAGARRQLMGVYSAPLVPLAASAMAQLGVRHALVVHGHGGLDEFSLAGETSVAEVCPRAAGELGIHQFTVVPESLGLAPAPITALAGGETAKDNAALLERLFGLEGSRRREPQHGPQRDVVLLNAGAVLMVAGLVQSLQEGVHLAAETIDAHTVARLIETLRR